MCIEAPNSRYSGDFEVDAVVALTSIEESTRRVVRTLELVNMFRQIPRYSAGASFLLQVYLL